MLASSLSFLPGLTLAQKESCWPSNIWVQQKQLQNSNKATLITNGIDNPHMEYGTSTYYLLVKPLSHIT